MKIVYRFLFVLLISMFLFGCGDKTAGIEGKIIDGKGKPVSGVSIIFKQVQPTQGYEQFETKTGPDGIFRLTGFAPSSEYNITPQSDKWKTKVTKKIKTLEAGQNLILSDPIKIRFNQMNDGTVIDTKTDLQWIISPTPDVTARNVINIVQNIKAGGFTDWRLPSRGDLEGLLEEKVPGKTPAAEPVSVTKTCCAWVAEPNSKEVDWKFYVEEDNDLWTSNKATPDSRIVVVRNFSTTPGATSVPPVAKTEGGQGAGTAPAVAPLTEGQTTAAVKTETPSVKPPGSVRHASRKACAAKRALAAKAAPVTAPAVAPVAAPAAAPAPVAAPAAAPAVATAGKTEIAKAAISTMAATKQEPAKITETSKSSLTETLYFGAASSSLTPQELVRLKVFSAKIKGGKGTLVIDGHSDTASNQGNNLLLSINRSSSVVVTLNKMGLGNNIKMEVRSWGDTKPIASNDTADGRTQNRRVIMSFVPE